jgi:hypothetical protein
MSEDEVIEYTNNLLENHKLQARQLTTDDYAEIKKWMRIAQLFPNDVHKYSPKYKKFYNRYKYIIQSMDTHILLKLIQEVLIELNVEPVNDKDFEYIAKGVIETISKMKSGTE